MQLQALIDSIASTSLSVAIREDFWIVPTVQSVHICAIAVVVGSALLNELRLTGLIATDETVATVVKRYLPWMWGALGVLLLTGLVLVWGEPERTLKSEMFWLKIGLVLIGFALSVLFRKPLLDPKFDTQGSAWSWVVKPVAWLSLLTWVAVVCCGRWIAYAG